MIFPLVIREALTKRVRPTQPGSEAKQGDVRWDRFIGTNLLVCNHWCLIELLGNKHWTSPRDRAVSLSAISPSRL